MDAQQRTALRLSQLTGGYLRDMTEKEMAEVTMKMEVAYVALTVYYAAALDLADSYLMDIDEDIKKGQKYNRTWKHLHPHAYNLLKQTRRMMKNLLTFMSDHLMSLKLNKGKEQLYWDVMDILQSESAEDIKKLRYVVLDVLHKHRVEDADFLATLETEAMLIAIARCVYDTYIEDVNRSTGIDVSGCYSVISPEKIDKKWDDFVRLVSSISEEQRTEWLQADELVKRGMNVIYLRITSITNAERNMQELVDEHPELLEDSEKIEREQLAPLRRIEERERREAEARERMKAEVAAQKAKEKKPLTYSQQKKMLKRKRLPRVEGEAKSIHQVTQRLTGVDIGPLMERMKRDGVI